MYIRGASGEDANRYLQPTKRSKPETVSAVNIMREVNFILFIFMVLSASDLRAQNENPKNDTLKFKPEKMEKSDNQTDAESTVRSLIDAMSENDAQKIRSLFDDNAKQAYGSGSWKSGNDFFSWLKSDIIDRKGHVDNAKFSTEGNQVVVTGQYSSEGYTNKANFLFEVENGKILSWQMRY